MAFRLFDAHNHLQDERLGKAKAELIETARHEGVIKMVVNGSREEDWDEVLDTNLGGTYFFSKAVVRAMLSQRPGSPGSRTASPTSPGRHLMWY